MLLFVVLILKQFKNLAYKVIVSAPQVIIWIMDFHTSLNILCSNWSFFSPWSQVLFLYSVSSLCIHVIWILLPYLCSHSLQIPFFSRSPFWFHGLHTFLNGLHMRENSTCLSKICLLNIITYSSIHFSENVIISLFFMPV